MLWEYCYAKNTVFESARLVALRMRILARLFNYAARNNGDRNGRQFPGKGSARRQETGRRAGSAVQGFRVGSVHQIHQLSHSSSDHTQLVRRVFERRRRSLLSSAKYKVSGFFINYIQSGAYKIGCMIIMYALFMSPSKCNCVLCRDVIEAETDEGGKEFSVRQIDFFNGYCSRSIPATEFFPLYILVHGILLIAPHYIWNAVFRGDFDSFFAVTRKLDRLRDRNTGEYDPTNFDRVEKLEIEFGGRRRKIFRFYIAKLIVQLCVCIGSYIFSAAFFKNFKSVFDCPRDLAESNVIPERWPLNVTIPCVYTSLRILALVRYADYILLGLAVCLILLGLLWCSVRHTKELGHMDIASFVFQSCLSTKTYVFPPFYEIRRRLNRSDNCWLCCYPFALFRRACRGCIACAFDFKIFSPRIQNDLDFFELYLFRADTSHGRVFKEIQIDKALRKLQGEDHQLLHLFLDAQRDMSAQIRDKSIAETRRQQAERERQSSGGMHGEVAVCFADEG